MPKLSKLFLFDIDGTLLHSKGASREAKSKAMLEIFGTDANIHKHPFGGKTDWQILREVLEPLGFDNAEIAQKMPTYELAFARYMAEVIGNFNVTPLAGTLELVRYVHERADWMLGLVTGNTSATTPVKLRAAGFDPALFVVGAYGNESDDRNQLPRLALDRANQLAQAQLAPHDVIVIGDTPADVECARALGAVAVAVQTGFASPDELRACEPDYLLDDLTQFLAAVSLV